MKDDLEELIQEARRAVRLASGIPLTIDEEAEERRLKETKEMNMFICNALSFKVMLKLNCKVIWTAKGVAAEFRIGQQVFHLRKNQDGYTLFAIKDQGERELTRIDAKDPIFANRVLVSIGDFSLDAANPAISHQRPL